MGDGRYDCQKRRLKVMKELEYHVEDLGFSSLYNEEPLRSSIYLVRRN